MPNAPMARAPSCLVTRALHDTSILSRRGLLGAGSAALALCSGVRAQQAPSPAAATVAAGTDGDKHMTIATMVNGRGPYRFVVDTGADRSVLSDTVAIELGLARQTKVLVEGVVRTVPAETVRLDEISFGVVRRKDVVVPVLARGWLGADGYIGLDMIGKHRVTFDFRAHQLSVEEPLSPWLLNGDGANTDTISADGWDGHLRALNCRIDGVMVTVFIDTGAEVSIANQALFNALIDHNPTYLVRAEATQITGVTGGVLNGQVFNFRKLKIKDLSFTDGALVVADLQIFDLWGLRERPAILIGMNFLRQFDRFSIDYRRHTFSFDVSRAGLYFAQAAHAVG